MPRLTIRIDLKDARLGPGKIRLLELVDTHGSITASGKQMEMSYRRAWLLIEELNHMFDAPLVETRPGGKGGGNARLTMLGRAIVQLYRGVEKDCIEAASRRLAELESHERKSPRPGPPSAAAASRPRKARMRA
jgi:molybdate transport system regulatory protein